MDLGLEGKVALVTGGSRGIGAAISLELGRQGCDVALTCQGRIDSAREVAAQIEEMGRKALALKADVASFTNAQETVDRVREDRSDFGRRYDPGHPAADKEGYVQTPNVKSMVEMMDMRRAQRSYEANLSVIRTSRSHSSTAMPFV